MIATHTTIITTSVFANIVIMKTSNNRQVEVLSNDFVKENDDFVSPLNSGYDEDTFDIIKSKRYVGLEIETNFRHEDWDNEPRLMI